MNKLIVRAFAAAAISFTALATAPASAALSVDPVVKTETATIKKDTANLIKVARRGGRGGFRGGRGFRGGHRWGGHRWNRGHRWGGHRWHRKHRWHRRHGWGYSRFGRCRALQAQGYRIRCFR